MDGQTDLNQTSKFELKADLAGVLVGDNYPVKIVGVINLSPESFFKPSVHTKVDEISQVAYRMQEDGADILDLGAASTAPPEYKDSFLVSLEVEKKRIIPAIRAVRDVTDVPISIDTQRSEIAKIALENGAEIVNDVSGFKKDPNMAKVVTDFGVPVILMATEKNPGDACKIEEIRSALRSSIEIAIKHGINFNQIVVDPGIGFGKPYECDLNILNDLKRLRTLFRPILVGISRKSFIGKVLNIPEPEKRLFGSLSATAIAVYNGVHIIRTHDVRETREVVRLAQAIRSSLEKVVKGDYTGQLVDSLRDISDAEDMFRIIDSSEIGIRLMKKKAIHLQILLMNLVTPAALALKQHMLSVGGDVVLPQGAIDFETKKCDVVLMGTVDQIEKIIPKLEIQSFDLPIIAKLLKDLLNSFFHNNCLE